MSKNFRFDKIKMRVAQAMVMAAVVASGRRELGEGRVVLFSTGLQKGPEKGHAGSQVGNVKGFCQVGGVLDVDTETKWRCGWEDRAGHGGGWGDVAGPVSCSQKAEGLEYMSMAWPVFCDPGGSGAEE